jgi:RNA polymerase-binding transcription factor DksA
VKPAPKAVKAAPKTAVKPVKPEPKKAVPVKAVKPPKAAKPAPPPKPARVPKPKPAPLPFPDPRRAPELKPRGFIRPPKKEEPVKEVKIPKTTVRTSVPYQPGYTPLDQRKESYKSNESLVRYSDTELNEFRELINKKLEAAKKELAYLQGLITRKDEMGGDETDNRYMTMEDGSMSMEREQLSQMASRQIQYIDHLEKALIRIENKTYGICRVTGKLIDKARLRAVPHATLSLEAKLGLVKPSSE